MVASHPQAPHPPAACAENDETEVCQRPHDEELDQHGDDEEDEEPTH